MRLGKGGAGLMPGIGYGTAGKMTATLVRSVRDFEKDCRYGIIFAGALGAKKVSELTAIAKEKGITIMNMKKVRRAKKIAKTIEKKHADKKDHKKEEKKESKKEEKKEEHKHEKHEAHVHKEGEHEHHEDHAHENHDHTHKEEHSKKE